MTVKVTITDKDVEVSRLSGLPAAKIAICRVLRKSVYYIFSGNVYLESGCDAVATSHDFRPIKEWKPNVEYTLEVM